MKMCWYIVCGTGKLSVIRSSQFSSSFTLRNILKQIIYSRALNLKITTLHFKRKVSTFFWLNQIILLQIITYLNTSNHHDCNKMHKLQCFHYSKNLWQNSKAPEQLLKQFFTSGSVNIVASQLYSVSGIIQQYSLCLCRITVFDQTFRL